MVMHVFSIHFEIRFVFLSNTSKNSYLYFHIFYYDFFILFICKRSTFPSLKWCVGVVSLISVGSYCIYHTKMMFLAFVSKKEDEYKILTLSWAWLWCVIYYLWLCSSYILARWNHQSFAHFLLNSSSSNYI